jgi:hypothetical protein
MSSEEMGAMNSATDGSMSKLTLVDSHLHLDMP